MSAGADIAPQGVYTALYSFLSVVPVRTSKRLAQNVQQCNVVRCYGSCAAWSLALERLSVGAS